MFIKAILLLLPMISQAKIDLSISIDDKNNVEIKYTGANIDVISNKERQSFGEKLSSFFVCYNLKCIDWASKISVKINITDFL